MNRNRKISFSVGQDGAVCSLNLSNRAKLIQRVTPKCGSETSTSIQVTFSSNIAAHDCFEVAIYPSGADPCAPRNTIPHPVFTCKINMSTTPNRLWIGHAVAQKPVHPDAPGAPGTGLRVEMAHLPPIQNHQEVTLEVTVDYAGGMVIGCVALAGIPEPLEFAVPIQVFPGRIVMCNREFTRAMQRDGATESKVRIHRLTIAHNEGEPVLNLHRGAMSPEALSALFRQFDEDVVRRRESCWHPSIERGSSHYKPRQPIKW